MTLWDVALSCILEFRNSLVDQTLIIAMLGLMSKLINQYTSSSSKYNSRLSDWHNLWQNNNKNTNKNKTESHISTISSRVDPFVVLHIRMEYGIICLSSRNCVIIIEEDEVDSEMEWTLKKFLPKISVKCKVNMKNLFCISIRNPRLWDTLLLSL